MIRETPHVNQVGVRKNGKPVVICPGCKRKVCVSTRDKIESHDSSSSGSGGWGTPCLMSCKEVHFHPSGD